MTDTFEPSLLSGYLDNELTDAEVAVVEQALAQDAQLQQELEEMRRLRAAIAALPMPAAQADMVAAVRRRIEQQQALRGGDSNRTTNATLKLLISFALAASVLVAVGWAILQQGRNDVPVALDRSAETLDTVPPQTPRPLNETPSDAGAASEASEASVAGAAERRSDRMGSMGGGMGGMRRPDVVQEELETAKPRAQEMARDASDQPSAAVRSDDDFRALAVPEPRARMMKRGAGAPPESESEPGFAPCALRAAPAPAAAPSQRMSLGRGLPSAGLAADASAETAHCSCATSTGRRWNLASSLQRRCDKRTAFRQTAG